MGCNCGGRKTTHQVVAPDGTVRQYSSEVEAKAAADKVGGEYQAIQR